MGLIYKITSPNGRLYVGKTYDLKKRIASHKSAAKCNDLNPIRTGHIFCYKDEYLEEYNLVA